MAEIVLGLGSNEGDRLGFLTHGLALLERDVRSMVISPVYESKAVLLEGAPLAWDIPYLNLVVAGTTQLSLEEVLQRSKAIEIELGRSLDAPRWSPRPIDIDILDYDGVVYQSEFVSVPHPEMVGRDFVLRPLADILPRWRHPVLAQDVDALLASFCQGESASKIRRTSFKIDIANMVAI